MNRSIAHRVSYPIVFAALLGPFIANCGAKLPGAAGLPGGGGACPDMNDIAAIDSFDFGASFGLKSDVATKVKAGVSAAVEMKQLADKIEGDLKTACGTLAHDLGTAGDFKDAQEACNAASKAIGDAKGKLGAKAKVSLEVDPPHCGVAIDAYADCAGKCDATVKPGELPKCDGGKMQGSCTGECSGSCEADASAVCSGECDGSCDAQIKGACSGTCQGKCDGKATPAGAGASCGGTCDGKCSGSVKATCSGKCGAAARSRRRRRARAPAAARAPPTCRRPSAPASSSRPR